MDNNADNNAKTETFDPPVEFETTIKDVKCKLQLKSLTIYEEQKEGETIPADVEYELLESDGHLCQQDIMEGLETIISVAIRDYVAQLENNDSESKED